MATQLGFGGFQAGGGIPTGPFRTAADTDLGASLAPAPVRAAAPRVAKEPIGRPVRESRDRGPSPFEMVRKVDVARTLFDGLFGGEDPFEERLAGRGIEFDPDDPARLAGQAAGIGAQFHPAFGAVEAGAGLVEMQQLNERLVSLGAQPISVLDAIMAGIDPTVDLRDLALDRAAQAGGFVTREKFGEIREDVGRTTTEFREPKVTEAAVRAEESRIQTAERLAAIPRAAGGRITVSAGKSAAASKAAKEKRERETKQARSVRAAKERSQKTRESISRLREPSGRVRSARETGSASARND